jgi:hypothetical protein
VNLATLTIERPSIEAADGTDASWSDLFRAGGIAAILFALLSIADAVVAFILPPPPSSGGIATLEYIIANRPGYIIFQALLVGPVGLTLITFPALYIALRHLNRSYAAIGSVIGVVSVVLCLVPFSCVNGLVYLSYQYAAATDAQHATFTAAAEALLAQNNSVSVGGVLFALSILVISIVMLKGVFSKWVAWLGIVSGGAGIICESLRPMIGAAFSIYGVVLIWLIAVGWKLYRLA